MKLYDLGTGRSSQKREILAIERCIKLVKPGTGNITMILPDGILNGDRNSNIREFIQKESKLLAVVGLNKETFEGYNATVKTSIFFLKRKEKPDDAISEKVFMAVCTNSGYAPTGLQVPGNQLPDILFDLKNYLKNNSAEPVFKYSKIVTLQNAGDRLDAERYIAVEKEADIGTPELTAENFFKELQGLQQQSQQIHNSLKRVYSEDEFEFIKTSELLNPIQTIIKVNPSEEYNRLGIRGKGGGVFIRETVSGEVIKADKLNQAKEGWFIYSRLFAHNGSFAYIDKNTAGGLFSNEFPTFELKETEF